MTQARKWHKRRLTWDPGSVCILSPILLCRENYNAPVDPHNKAECHN